MASLAHPEHF
jgi:hypothetical protein